MKMQGNPVRSTISQLRDFCHGISDAPWVYDRDTLTYTSLPPNTAAPLLIAEKLKTKGISTVELETGARNKIVLSKEEAEKICSVEFPVPQRSL